MSALKLNSSGSWLLLHVWTKWLIFAKIEIKCNIEIRPHWHCNISDIVNQQRRNKKAYIKNKKHNIKKL